MDSLIPTTIEVPDIEMIHVETPSPLNLLEIKGVGETGFIPVPALMASTVEDALSSFAVHVTDMSRGANQIRDLIHKAGRGVIEGAVRSIGIDPAGNSPTL
jgi:carbon-monoxide dehydrogenase large subunit